MVLSPEIERLLLIVVFLPNVVMAWKFGWQGGVLSGLLGSMMITLARQVGVGFGNLVELEIFLATQALLGICLGIAISRQQHLAQNLHHYQRRTEEELAARRALTEKLIHTEEDTRKTWRASCTMKSARTSPRFKSSRSWSNGRAIRRKPVPPRTR